MLDGISKDRRYQKHVQFVFHLNSTLMASSTSSACPSTKFTARIQIDRLSNLNGKERVEIFFAGLIQNVRDVVEQQDDPGSKYYQRIAGYVKDHSCRTSARVGKRAGELNPSFVH